MARLKKQKIQVIVCSEDANVKVKIVFNNSIKDIVSEGFNGTKGEKSLTFILDDKVKSFQLEKKITNITLSLPRLQYKEVPLLKLNLI